MSIKYTEQSRIFRDFRSIPYSDYYYLIRFYEQNHRDINHLPFDEGMIMSFYYTNALFETGEHNAHILCANQLLEESIINNIRYIDGQEVYQTMLYQKTCSHLHLGQNERAIDLAKQLVGIAPNTYQNIDLLRQCLLHVRPRWIKPTLLISAVAMIICSLAMIVYASLHLYTIPNAMLLPYSLMLLTAAGLGTTAWGYYKYIAAPLRQIVIRAKYKKEKQLQEEEVLV